MDGFDTETREHFNCHCTTDPNPYLTNLIELYKRDQMVSIAQFRALIDELLKEKENRKSV